MRRFSGSVSVISYDKPNPLISKRQGGLPKFLNSEYPALTQADTPDYRVERRWDEREAKRSFKVWSTIRGNVGAQE